MRHLFGYASLISVDIIINHKWGLDNILFVAYRGIKI